MYDVASSDGKTKKKKNDKKRMTCRLDENTLKKKLMKPKPSLSRWVSGSLDCVIRLNPALRRRIKSGGPRMYLGPGRGEVVTSHARGCRLLPNAEDFCNGDHARSSVHIPYGRTIRTILHPILCWSNFVSATREKKKPVLQVIIHKVFCKKKKPPQPVKQRWEMTNG